MKCVHNFNTGTFWKIETWKTEDNIRGIYKNRGTICKDVKWTELVRDLVQLQPFVVTELNNRNILPEGAEYTASGDVTFIQEDNHWTHNINRLGRKAII